MFRDTLKHFPVDRLSEDQGGEEVEGDGDPEPGHCLLCDRHMPLTRHHVMPRSGVAGAVVCIPITTRPREVETCTVQQALDC